MVYAMIELQEGLIMIGTMLKEYRLKKGFTKICGTCFGYHIKSIQQDRNWCK